MTKVTSNLAGLRVPQILRDPASGVSSDRGDRLPKIFQIGFNKCGTATIHHYLSANGVRSIHWDGGRLAMRLFANLANGENLLAGYEEFDAFTDMEYLDSHGVFLEGYKLFRYFADQHPTAVFILNTRDREAWIRSRLGHGASAPYATRQMVYHNVTTIGELTDIWRADWDRHHRRVIDFFSDNPFRFFVLKIETDLPYLLNEKLPEWKLDPQFYRIMPARDRASLLRRSLKFILGPHATILDRFARQLRGANVD